jgi:hypothetical protein
MSKKAETNYLPVNNNKKIITYPILFQNFRKPCTDYPEKCIPYSGSKNAKQNKIIRRKNKIQIFVVVNGDLDHA